MGQYYHPVFHRNKKGSFMYSHDYGDGLKLMEHSWMKNGFVKTFEEQISDNPALVVWAGDYADNEKKTSPFFNKALNDKRVKDGAEGHSLYDLCYDPKYKEPGDEKLYKKISFTKIQPVESETDFQYIVNNTTKQFVDKRKAKKDKDGWQVHPLPLLTVEGNNRGGGDYRLENKNIGIWARNEIYVSNTKPQGYTELIPNFLSDMN